MWRKLKKEIILRSEKQLSYHKERICKCGKIFILTNQTIFTDLFKTQSYEKLTPLPLHCRSYLCEKCSTVKRAKFIQRIKTNLAGETWRFMTLTTINTGGNTVYNLQTINQNWNKLITFLRRKYTGIKYVKVLEVGRGGMVHLHVLINRFIPQQLIRNYWRKYTGAFIIEISKAQDYLKSVYYMASYMKKQFNNTEVNELFFKCSKRRYSFSLNWEKLATKESSFKLFGSGVFSGDDLLLQLCKLCFDGDIELKDLDLNYLDSTLVSELKDNVITLYEPP